MSSNEWFTPAKYIQAVREVMGSIDLDPASCAYANRIVQATCYYTQADNGLMHPWIAERVFLNPPYGRTPQGNSHLEYFTSYLLAQYHCGNTKQAILLIPANTATRWFTPLWDFPICFPSYRIRFYNEQGPSDGVSFGTCFVYLGPNIETFMAVFSQLGTIVGRISSAKVQYRNGALWNEVPI